MKRMKRFLGLLLCGILALGCLVSCGEVKVIEAVNENIKAFVERVVEGYIEEGDMTAADVLEKIYKDSTIKYKDIEIDDNIATVTVEVKSKNFNSIILRATDVAISNIDLLTPAETLMNNAMWEVYDKEEPEEREVEITLTKLDDTWIIDPESVSNVTYLITGIKY